MYGYILLPFGNFNRKFTHLLRFLVRFTVVSYNHFWKLRKVYNKPIRHGSMSAWTNDDVIKWKHFPRYWPFVRRIHRSPVNSSHKGQWRGALMFSLICVWINDWVNNGEAGDLKRYRIHYDVTVMKSVTRASWQSGFSVLVIEIWTFPFRKILLQLSSGKGGSFCLGLNVISEIAFECGFEDAFSRWFQDTEMLSVLLALYEKNQNRWALIDGVDWNLIDASFVELRLWWAN